MKMKLALVTISAAALIISADCQAMMARARVKQTSRTLAPMPKVNLHRSFAHKKPNNASIFGHDYDLTNIGQEFRRFRYSHNRLTEKMALNRPGALEWTPKEKERFSSHCPILKEWVNATVEMNAKYYAGFDHTVQKHLCLHHKLLNYKAFQNFLSSEQKEEIMKSYNITQAELRETIEEHIRRLERRDDIQ